MSPNTAGTNPGGIEAFYEALAADDSELVRRELAAGVSPNSERAPDAKLYPLEYAMEHGAEKSALLLIRAGADVHRADAALNMAVFSEKVLFALLARGVTPPSAMGANDAQTLFKACVTDGGGESMRLLLAAGLAKHLSPADILEEFDGDDDQIDQLTAVDYAAQFWNAGVLDALAEAGWDIAAVDGERPGAVHRAAQGSAIAYDISRFDDTLAVLARHGMDANATDARGDTALWYAAQSGNERTLVRLLELGLDPHHRNHAGRTVADQLAEGAEEGSLDAATSSRMRQLLASYAARDALQRSAGAAATAPAHGRI